MEGMKVLVIIPAKDEAMTVGKVIRDVQRHGWHDILVVNDSSKDETGAVAVESGALVMEPPIHLGAWGAIQTGMRYAVKNNYGAAVTIDADGQHEPGDISLLMERLGQSDVVTGASPERGGFGKNLVWNILRSLSGLAVQDMTSGFRAYSGKAMALLTGYESLLIDYQDVGVLLLCFNNGLGLAEVPVKMNPRQYGSSRIFSNAMEIIRYLFSTFYLIGAKRW